MPKTQKRLERDAKYRKPIWIRDADVGLCSPQPWRVLQSAGYAVLQIDTRPGLTRLDINKDHDPSMVKP